MEAIAPGLFTWPSEDPRLLGARCDECGTTTFPSQHGCPSCGAEAMTVTELGSRGTLWTWTTQGYLPKAPYAGPETEATFTGWVLGYVELPGEVKVETRIVGVEPADVRIGMELELVVEPFTTRADGTEVVGYAFRPVRA